MRAAQADHPGGAVRRAAPRARERRALKRQSVRRELILLVASALVPLFLFSIAVVLWDAATTRRAVETALRETAQSLSLAIDREIAASLSALQALAASPALDGERDDFARQAREVAAHHGGWIAMSDARGRQLFNTLAGPGEPAPPAQEEPHVRAVFDTGRPVVSGLFDGALGGQPVIAVYFPVRRDGEVRYALGLAIAPGRIAALLDAQPLPPGWLGMVLDGSGRIVARSAGQGRYLGAPAADWHRAALSGAASGLLSARSLEGEAMRLAYERIPASGWTVAVAVPERSLATAWGRPLAALSAAGAAVALLALALAWLFARRIAALVGRQVRERAAVEAASRSKDEFLATLSHELRTPVAAIVGWIAVLRARRGDPEKTEQALAVIERNALQQARLIDDLLDVSRIVAGKLKLERRPVDLSRALAEALDGVRPLAREKGIAVEARIAPSLRVEGDPARLVQIATNLLVNAVKFTPEGGRVEASLARRGGEAELAVRDNGRGIEPHVMPQLFERFSQAEPHGGYRPGLGLGLAIVRRLAELHGGGVRAESEGAGRGATFIVRLPALRDPPPADAAAKRAGAPTLHGLRVLVVDDHQDGRRWLAELLAARGATTGEASYAGEALEVEARLAPDVIVSDIAMPRGDGYELVRALRARGRRTPTLALTALAAGEERERALREGFDAVLAKGGDPEAIVGTVARFAASMQNARLNGQ